MLLFHVGIVEKMKAGLTGSQLQMECSDKTRKPSSRDTGGCPGHDYDIPQTSPLAPQPALNKLWIMLIYSNSGAKVGVGV